ncbi:unnamed protein product [Rotaria sp. Silwood2]|nr:unnamed protein product [Rotaria sp. Silwood2]CAF3179160.1 unnamed protein product [Rotaria sp. Silwood2]CAF4009669.1 unnamed protein product [Rotaria sp. Silwood2]CAF4529339.1 unnamed protein product [Rotaria sp. Silwood2]
MSLNLVLPNLETLNSRKIHHLLSSQENTITFLQDLKLLPRIPNVTERCGEFDNHDWYLGRLKRLTDGYTFRCHRCQGTRSIRKGTFFELSHLSLDSIFELMYYWSREEDSIAKLMHELKIGSNGRRSNGNMNVIRFLSTILVE